MLQPEEQPKPPAATEKTSPKIIYIHTDQTPEGVSEACPDMEREASLVVKMLGTVIRWHNSAGLIDAGKARRPPLNHRNGTHRR